MKMRTFYLIAVAVVAIFTAGCNKNEAPKDNFERQAFDAPILAAALGENFDDYCTANADYVITSKSSASKKVLGGYIEIEGEEYLLNIAVTKDRYGKVGSVVATPESKSASETLMKYFLNNSEAESLGAWQGANWKTTQGVNSTSGIYQTVEQALSQMGAGLSGLTIDAIYSVISGRAYAVATIENESFKMSLVNNFYRLDFDVLVGLLGSNWSKLQSDNRFISYKSGFGTLYYVWFYYARDLRDALFNMSAYADEQRLTVKTIRLTMHEELSLEAQLEAWAPYAVGDEQLSLGEFSKAYLADSTGAEIEPLASQEAVLQYVDENGRPEAFDNDVVVEYVKGDATILVTLNSQYVTIDIY